MSFQWFRVYTEMGIDSGAYRSHTYLSSYSIWLHYLSVVELSFIQKHFWLVVWNIFYFSIFRGVETTNQICFWVPTSHLHSAFSVNSRGYFGNPAMKFRRLSSQAAGWLPWSSARFVV